MQPHFAMLARYNAWANGRVYDAAAALTDAQYRADRGAFFKSVHGTLNHLLVADRIWMRRFTGEGEAPSRLDAILFETSGETARRAGPGGCAHRGLCGRPLGRRRSPGDSATARS